MINKLGLPEILTDRLYTNATNTKVEQSGLLSEVFFGPIKKFKCACGKLSIKTIHTGEICPECGVTCENNVVRYSKFAKIVLPFHIVNTLNKSKFNKVIKREFKSFLNPNQYDLISSINIFLEYNITTDEFQLTSSYSILCLPIKITGIYSFFLALNAIAIHYKSTNANEFLQYFYNEVLVLPPECRLVLNTTDKSRTIIKHKVVDIYIKIIRLKQYILKDNKDIEENFTEHLNLLLDSLVTGDETLIDDSTVSMYDSLASKLQYYTDVLYEEVLILLSGKSGIIRSDFLGKNIDFSARAVVVNDPSLAAHQIRIPREAFLKLWFLEYYNFIQKQAAASQNNFKLANQSLSRLLIPVENSLSYIDFNEFTNFSAFVDWFLTNAPIENKLIYINRQPTLWRYGLLGVEVVGVNEKPVISVSPLIIKSLGMDFDGDTAALYRVHDHRSMRELYENSFVMNLITYDHNDSLLIDLSNEAMYGYEVLRSAVIDESQELISIDRIDHLIYDHKIHITAKTHIRNTDTVIPYGLALLNNFASLKTCLITKDTKSSEALKLILNNSLTNEKYQHNSRIFLEKIWWFLSTHQQETLTLPFIESAELINKVKHNKLVNKLPQNPYLGSYIYHSIVDNIYQNLPKHFQLYKLTKSKFRQVQFSRSLIAIGYIADNQNLISPKPVKNNIITGLTEDEFFETSFGTRKGIVDKADNVPDAGYMQRSMVINLSSLEIVEEDCGTNVGFKITILNSMHNQSLLNRYFINEFGSLVLYDKSYAYDDSNIGKMFLFRSPITCQTADFKVCRKCVGQQKFKSPYIGLMAGQYIEERLTQLTMSSFHNSGSASIKLDPILKEFFRINLNDIEEYENEIVVKFKHDLDQEIISKFVNTPEFRFVKQLNPTDLLFNKYHEKLENEDVGKIIKKVNSILATQLKNNLIPLNEAYNDVVTSLHQISDIYSIFIELLLANSYVNKNNTIIRYAIKNGEPTDIYKKYNTKQLHKLQSKTLSLIYEPNKNSILDYYKDPITSSQQNLSIFEKIWASKI